MLNVLEVGVELPVVVVVLVSCTVSINVLVLPAKFVSPLYVALTMLLPATKLGEDAAVVNEVAPVTSRIPVPSVIGLPVRGRTVKVTEPVGMKVLEDIGMIVLVRVIGLPIDTGFGVVTRLVVVGAGVGHADSVRVSKAESSMKLGSPLYVAA